MITTSLRASGWRWIVGALAFSLWSLPAAADWRLCNESSYIVEAAIGYQDGGEVWTEGWIRMRPGDCATAIEGDVRPGPHYLYARSSPAHRGGRREWSGSTPLCVDEMENSFFLSSTTVCENAGAVTQQFSTIDVGETPWRTRLVEPNAPTLGTAERAITKGLQRLLSDAGYYAANRIDGISGRRTDRAVASFLSDTNRRGTPPMPELMDLLETAALSRDDGVGLKLCNRSDAVVWSAIATRVDRTWESRGWWPLDIGDCATVIDQELDETAYYVYADKKDDRGPRPLSAGEEVFCLAQTRFAILGREDCAQRGFEEGRFIRVSPEDGGAVTVEFTTDDFAEPIRLEAQ